MNTTQVVWGVVTILVAVSGFMIKVWMKNMSEKVKVVNDKLTCKQDKTVCAERYPNLKSDVAILFRHKHPIVEGESMTAEVIIPS
jgi:hypothetical protein